MPAAREGARREARVSRVLGVREARRFKRAASDRSDCGNRERRPPRPLSCCELRGRTSAACVRACASWAGVFRGMEPVPRRGRPYRRRMMRAAAPTPLRFTFELDQRQGVARPQRGHPLGRFFLSASLPFPTVFPAGKVSECRPKSLKLSKNTASF